MQNAFMDAAEYKHIVLGMIFLKYVSDAFTERRTELARRFADPKDEYFIEDEKTRAKILAGAQLSKLLIGSDFPIMDNEQWSFLRFQEEQLLRFGLSERDIERVYQNAIELARATGVR